MAQKKARLDRTAVLHGARQVLDETGIDGFTTRALATHLGVQQPGLYWHFRTKADLLTALATDILDREHHAALPNPGEQWDAFLVRNARSFRNALHAVRDGARLHAEYHHRPGADVAAGTAGTTGPGPDTDNAPVQQIRLLVSQGFDPVSAVRALIAVSRYTVGVALEEQTAGHPDAGSDDPPVAWPDNPDGDFEFGLTALVHGLSPDL